MATVLDNTDIGQTNKTPWSWGSGNNRYIKLSSNGQSKLKTSGKAWIITILLKEVSSLNFFLGDVTCFLDFINYLF